MWRTGADVQQPESGEPKGGQFRKQYSTRFPGLPTCAAGGGGGVRHSSDGDSKGGRGHGTEGPETLSDRSVCRGVRSVSGPYQLTYQLCRRACDRACLLRGVLAFFRQRAVVRAAVRRTLFRLDALLDRAVLAALNLGALVTLAVAAVPEAAVWTQQRHNNATTTPKVR